MACVLISVNSAKAAQMVKAFGGGVMVESDQ